MDQCTDTENQLFTHPTTGRCVSRNEPGFRVNLIRCALAATGGCRIDAARLLGIGRNTIARKIHAYGLDSADASFHSRTETVAPPQRTD